MKNTIKVGEMTFGWGPEVLDLPHFGPPMALGDELFEALGEALVNADCILFVTAPLRGQELFVLSPTLETRRPVARPGAEGQRVQVYKIETPSEEEEGIAPAALETATGAAESTGAAQNVPPPTGGLEGDGSLPDRGAVTGTSEPPPEVPPPADPAVEPLPDEERPKGVPDETPPTGDSLPDATGDEGEASEDEPAPPKEREGA